MKRKPQLTKRERKAVNPRPAQPQGGHDHGHIHCVACGKHLDPSDFDAPATATTITCDHGSTFASCVRCVPQSTALIQEHDRTGQPIRSAQAWH